MPDHGPCISGQRDGADITSPIRHGNVVSNRILLKHVVARHALSTDRSSKPNFTSLLALLPASQMIWEARVEGREYPRKKVLMQCVPIHRSSRAE